jgi:hypothetical protein
VRLGVVLEHCMHIWTWRSTRALVYFSEGFIHTRK